MFLVNSRLESFAAVRYKTGQSLSRSYGRYFAEFLNASFLDHLRILILPTGVGLRYGQHCPWLEDFLVSLDRLSQPGLHRTIPCNASNTNIRGFSYVHMALDAYTHHVQ